MKLLVLMTIAAVAGAQNSCTFRTGPEINAIIETGIRNSTLNGIADQTACAEACCRVEQCNWYVHQASTRTCELWEQAEQRGQMPGFVSAEKGDPLPTQPIATIPPDNDAATEGPMVVTFVLSLAVSLLLYANDVLM